MVIIFGFCHLVGMGSAVVNPVLYCYLNKNFRSVYIFFLKNLSNIKPVAHHISIKTNTLNEGQERGDSLLLTAREAGSD